MAPIRFRLSMRSALPLLAGLLSLATTTVSPTLGSAARAQDAAVPFSAVRAVNLARGTAIARNGGLGIYHPAQCMYETASAGNQCLIRTDADGYLFRFLGGAPGWQQLGLPATVETEVLIAPDGRSVVQMFYNGAPR